MARKGRKRIAKGAAQGPRGGASTALASVVRELADRREIEDVVIRYGHALDSRDDARLRDCMKSDARVKYGDSEWLNGVDEAARFCANALDPLDASQHRVSSIDVKLESDRATSTAYVCAEHLRAGRRFTVGGSYLDVWERTSAGWRIAQRRLAIAWTEGSREVIRGPAPS